MQVLVAMADDVQAARIAELLAQAGHHAQRVESQTAVLRVATETPFDLLVLDGSGSSLDGHAVLDALRLSRPTLPILLITAPGDVDARVLGLSQGADDALEAPFHGAQLLARASALTRRADRAPQPAEVVELDGCRLDLSAHVAQRGVVRVQLTAREVGIVRWLHTHRARTVSRAELLEHVWGLSPKMETRTVDMAISGLRKKIERDPASPRIVLSVRGAGYRLTD